MERNRRFELLAGAEAADLVALAEAVLAAADAAVPTPPRVGTVLMQLREPVEGTRFHLGEVVVAEASARIDGHEGYAMRLGRDAEAALAAAVLDAAAEARHELSPRIEALLNQLAAEARARDLAAWRSVAATRVAFDEIG